MHLRYKNMGSVLRMKLGHFLMGTSIDEVELSLPILDECLSYFLYRFKHLTLFDYTTDHQHPDHLVIFLYHPKLKR